MRGVGLQADVADVDHSGDRTEVGGVDVVDGDGRVRGDGREVRAAVGARVGEAEDDVGGGVEVEVQAGIVAVVGDIGAGAALGTDEAEFLDGASGAGLGLADEGAAG